MPSMFPAATSSCLCPSCHAAQAEQALRTFNNSLNAATGWLLNLGALAAAEPQHAGGGEQPDEERGAAATEAQQAEAAAESDDQSAAAEEPPALDDSSAGSDSEDSEERLAAWAPGRAAAEARQQEEGGPPGLYSDSDSMGSCEGSEGEDEPADVSASPAAAAAPTGGAESL